MMIVISLIPQELSPARGLLSRATTLRLETGQTTPMCRDQFNAAVANTVVSFDENHRGFPFLGKATSWALTDNQGARQNEQRGSIKPAGLQVDETVALRRALRDGIDLRGVWPARPSNHAEINSRWESAP